MAPSPEQRPAKKRRRPEPKKTGAAGARRPTTAGVGAWRPPSIERKKLAAREAAAQRKGRANDPFAAAKLVTLGRDDDDDLDDDDDDEELDDDVADDADDALVGESTRIPAEEEEDEYPEPTSLFGSVGDEDAQGRSDPPKPQKPETSVSEAERAALVASAKRAKHARDAYASLLEVRVLLQAVATAVDKHIPAAKKDQSADGGTSSSGTAVGALRRLTRTLLALRGATQKQEGDASTANEAAAAAADPSSLEALWREVDAPFAARRAHWESTMEAWRGRTSLGAAAKRKRLEALDVGPFEAARHALKDRDRAQRKVHPPVSSGRTSDALDYERYDDAPLYRAHLREVLEAGDRGRRRRSGDDDDQDDDDAPTAYAVARAQLGDDAALRKRHNLGKDTARDRGKKSKGRALRVETHEKLQHFMFPVGAVDPQRGTSYLEPAVDVDLLVNSLFK